MAFRITVPFVSISLGKSSEAKGQHCFDFNIEEKEAKDICFSEIPGGGLTGVLFLYVTSPLSLKYLIPAKKFSEVSVRATAFNFSSI